MERRHDRRKKVEELVSEDEENWSYARRSCRRHKLISYNFEEFDQLISGAIEDDVKEPDLTRKCCVVEVFVIFCARITALARVV